MIWIIASAAIVCAASLVIGQALLRLCGASGWSWLAPSVGLSTIMALA